MENFNDVFGPVKDNKKSKYMFVLLGIAQDLSRLDLIEEDSFKYDEHKIVLEVLQKAKEIGLESANGAQLVKVAEMNYKTAEGYIEGIRAIEGMIDRFNEEGFDFMKTIRELNIENGTFKSLSLTLMEERARVKHLVSQQIEVPGFPIPILKGKLNSIVAPSHSGKTYYGMGLAFSLARAGKRVMFLSTEEDKEAFIEKTMGVDVDDEAWDNISFVYQGSFSKLLWESFIRKVSEEDFEYLIIDYLKKSMWDNYTSDHVVMEEINSALLRVNAELKNKLGVFALVQGNRAAFDTDMEELIDNTGKVALMIDGGMPVYRSADNVMFIKNKDGKRYLLVAKCRRNSDMLGAKIEYDVQSDFKVIVAPVVKFDSSKRRGGF